MEFWIGLMIVDVWPQGNPVRHSEYSSSFNLTPHRPDEAAQLSFSCSRRRGAILSLPAPAQRKDTVARGAFAKFILKHIDEWFAFARECDFGISREDIILVTGCHLAKTWATVAFQAREEQLSFGVQVSGVSDITWQFTPEGAGGVAFNLGPSGQVRYCIYISRLNRHCDRSWTNFNRISESTGEPVHIHPGISCYSVFENITLASRSSRTRSASR